MPRISEILFPAPRGGYMSRSSWSAYWQAVRASAGIPNSSTEPSTTAGLSLDSQTVAQMVGHNDGGYLIATVYTKLAERRALAARNAQ